LLKLTRIGWLTGATIPSGIRLELLKNLGLPEELVTRKAILGLLKESDDLIVADTRPFDAKMLQVYTQSFILFAHDPRRNAALEPDARKFMSVWDRHRAADLATVLYLTNPDRRWETPVRSIGDPTQTIGANKFINELLALRVIHNPRIRAFFRKLAFSFFFILFLLFLFKDFIQPTALNKAIGLIDHDYPDRPVTVIIPIDGCLRQMLTGHAKKLRQQSILPADRSRRQKRHGSRRLRRHHDGRQGPGPPGPSTDPQQKPDHRLP